MVENDDSQDASPQVNSIWDSPRFRCDQDGDLHFYFDRSDPRADHMRLIEVYPDGRRVDRGPPAELGSGFWDWSVGKGWFLDFGTIAHIELLAPDGTIQLHHHRMMGGAYENGQMGQRDANGDWRWNPPDCPLCPWPSG